MARNNAIVDFSSLHVLLTLDFIGDIAYGVDLQAISQGSDCRILQLLDIILPELMKSGLFPLRAKIPILKRTRDMHRAVLELRSMAEKAVENTRIIDGTSERSKDPSNKIFAILAKYWCQPRWNLWYLLLLQGSENPTEATHSAPKSL